MQKMTLVHEQDVKQRLVVKIILLIVALRAKMALLTDLEQMHLLDLNIKSKALEQQMFVLLVEQIISVAIIYLEIGVIKENAKRGSTIGEIAGSAHIQMPTKNNQLM